MGGLSVLRRLPVWVPPALLTLAVTLAGLDRAQLWRDELATWSAATRPVGDLLRLADTIDAATGPYYLLMHAWVAVAGDSTAALRLPAALAMTGAAALTAVLGERLSGRSAGLLAGLLFAVLPGTSRYGQEARPYALATALAVLATLLLVAALDPPPGTRPARRAARWAGYAVTVAALGLTHLVALTLLAAHGVVVLAAARRHGRRGVAAWLLALVPAVLLVGPLLLVARGQRARQLDWVDAARPEDLTGLAGGVAQSGVVGGVLVGLAALGAARLGRRALLPGAAVVLPVLLVFAAGLLVPLWVPRYLVFVVPFGCLLAGAALAGVPLLPALGVVALAGALGLPDQAALRRTHEWPRSASVDYAGAARVVAAEQRPGDAVVYSPRGSWLFLDLGLEYHLGDHRPRDVLVTADQARRADLWAAECARPAECLAGAGRVWLVVAGRHADPLTAVPGAKGAALRAGWTTDQVWPHPGLTTALLTPR
ncbi:glycosyltransferase family 39 protein [Micromonospora sp. NPDC126480]|uniref:glycosyltransferase family 39 protein n=1 Tax=Micromonospora sp. NPDC126480 TaxID=3155312 RepID=UPI003317EF0F